MTPPGFSSTSPYHAHQASFMGQISNGRSGILNAKIGRSGSNVVPKMISPHVFSVTTPQDPTIGAWNMDIGASSHLNDSVTSLSDVLIMFVNPSVSVGDGYTIPVTNFGHSILPTPHRPLHLNKVLLRCDSTSDLYPVTKPSPHPHAFLTSQHTWHQRLGHPGSEVFRRLISRNSISCNKEKPPILFHACQLRKHVRLPFVSSNTLVKSCFDIVYSDVWTSLIPSLSGLKYYVLFLDHYS
ncbi:ribonuclease H-like domain-containing protein [Tanacetum coccineum]